MAGGGGHIRRRVRDSKVNGGIAKPRAKRFLRLTGDYFDTFLGTARLRALAGPITELFVAIGTAILLWYGARMVVVEGSLTGAEFIGFIILSTRLYSPVKYLSKLPALVQPGLVGAERIFEFLDAPAEIRDRAGAGHFAGLHEGIRYTDVRLEYREGEPVLADLSFFAPAGSVVAIVGPSGAGKTSIVDLLGRFYEPAAGAVEIDGTDIRDLRLTSLRSALGVVSQDTVLFHDTVRATSPTGRSTLRWTGSRPPPGPLTPTTHIEAPRRVRHGGRRARDHALGRKRQRIAIARAVLCDPHPDPRRGTSALDRSRSGGAGA